MKRPPQRSRPRAERWMVSYADFVTLLFAFFVLLFAVSSRQQAAIQDVAASVQQAFAPPAPAAAPVQPRPCKNHAGASQSAACESLDDVLRQLNQLLAGELSAGSMQLRKDERGIVISLTEKSFFPSGLAEIPASAFPSLDKVAAVLLPIPNAVRLEGHTDSVPIHTPRFRDNWDLSAARGIAVLNWFESHHAMSPQRFAISGFADNLPVAGNDSEAGRARNRRVDIVIVNSK